VACSLGNPYKNTGEMQTIRLKFDARNLQDIESRLDFHVFVNSTSNETELENDFDDLTVIVIKLAELSIQG